MGSYATLIFQKNLLRFVEKEVKSAIAFQKKHSFAWKGTQILIISIARLRFRLDCTVLRTERQNQNAPCNLKNSNNFLLCHKFLFGHFSSVSFEVVFFCLLVKYTFDNFPVLNHFLLTAQLIAGRLLGLLHSK